MLQPGIEEKYAMLITNTHKRYKAKTKEATSYLARAESYFDELKAIYDEAMDEDKLTQIQCEIQSEIDAIAEIRYAEWQNIPISPWSSTTILSAWWIVPVSIEAVTSSQTDSHPVILLITGMFGKPYN